MKDTEEQPIMITVPLSEILEILSLSSAIESPTAVFRKEDRLAMANEVVEKSIATAGQISNILHKWTHGEYQ